ECDSAGAWAAIKEEQVSNFGEDSSVKDIKENIDKNKKRLNGNIYFQTYGPFASADLIKENKGVMPLLAHEGLHFTGCNNKHDHNHVEIIVASGKIEQAYGMKTNFEYPGSPPTLCGETLLNDRIIAATS